MTVMTSFSDGGRCANLAITGELTSEESLRLCELLPMLGPRYYQCERFEFYIDATGTAFEMAPAILEEIDRLRAGSRTIAAKIFSTAVGVPALLFAYADIGKRSMRPDASLCLFKRERIGFSVNRTMSALQQEIVKRLCKHSAAMAHAPETALFGRIAQSEAQKLGLADSTVTVPETLPFKNAARPQH